jgi:hypothetical protein
MLRSSEVSVVLYLIQKKKGVGNLGDGDQEDEQVVRLLGQTAAQTARSEVSWVHQRDVISEIEVHRLLPSLVTERCIAAEFCFRERSGLLLS